LVSGFGIFGKLANLDRLRAYMCAGHRPRIVVSSCLAGLFVRLTGLFVRLTGFFVRLAGLFVSLAGFWVFGNKICQTVGDEIFFPPHIILGIDKQRDLRNKICQTIGDALIFLLQRAGYYLLHGISIPF
jgi:hypothetical protein